MKYAVIYQSKSGNTKRIAEAIYGSIDEDEKVILDIDQSKEIPDADFYFIGFGIHNNTCGIDVSVMMEQNSFNNYALFITCGLCPTEAYTKKLLSNIEVWLPDDYEPVDIFICQGKTEKHIQNAMISRMPRFEDKLQKIFREGSEHPNENDIENARLFAHDIIELYSKRGSDSI